MWDDEDYEPAPFESGNVVTDKWDGEDEEDDVKDAWDADSDDEATKASSPAADDEEDEEGKAKQVKKKKKLADILKEKEERRRQEAEDLQKAKERLKELTAEEKAAEKARIKKEQEEADLLLARQVFGLDDVDESSFVDGMTPTDSASFADFKDALVKKLKKSENSPHYVAFLDSLMKNLCLQIDVDQVRKISASLTAAELEKRREAKKKSAKKGGAAGSGSGGASKSGGAAKSNNKVAAAALPSKKDADALDFGGDVGGSSGRGEDAYDDLDDFM